jgi:hypothetical protein
MKISRIILILIFSSFLFMQFYTVPRINPPVVQKIKMDAGTEKILRRACFDCHSNETIWPWYSTVAPVSWLFSYDVNKGREKLNFSNGKYSDLKEIAEEVREGKMPLKRYIFLHPEARLTEKDKEALINGLKNILPPHGENFTEGKDND